MKKSFSQCLGVQLPTEASWHRSRLSLGGFVMLAAVCGGLLLGGVACRPGTGGDILTPPAIAAKNELVTIICVDVSASIPAADLNLYQQLLFSTVDACAGDGPIIIICFSNQRTSTALARVYEGKPESADDVMDIARQKIYPKRRAVPGGATDMGTTYEGALQFCQETCKTRPVRAIFISDGQLNGATSLGRTDDAVISSCRRYANALATEPNFRGIAVVPVSDGVASQTLHGRLFATMEVHKPTWIASRETASEAILQFSQIP